MKLCTICSDPAEYMLKVRYENWSEQQLVEEWHPYCEHCNPAAEIVDKKVIKWV